MHAYLTKIQLLPLLIFFFTNTATTEIYTLSLHDALPIWPTVVKLASKPTFFTLVAANTSANAGSDRKSTRLNSSHVRISYAVFCLKKISHINHMTGTPDNQPRSTEKSGTICLDDCTAGTL